DAQRFAVVEQHRAHLGGAHRLHAAAGDALEQHVQLELAVEDVGDLLQDLQVPQGTHLLVEQARVLDGGRDLGRDTVERHHVPFVERVHAVALDVEDGDDLAGQSHGDGQLGQRRGQGGGL